MKLLVNAVGIWAGGGAQHLSSLLPALQAARPAWELYVCVDPRLDLARLPDGLSVTQVARGVGRRLWWDFAGAERLARTSDVDCVLNLANYGPLFPSVPSVMVQCNPVYFDPSWLARSGTGFRAEAALRRRLAFREMSRCSAVVAPGEAMAGFLRSWPQWDTGWRLVIVPYGVDTATFTYRPRALDLAGPVRLLSVCCPCANKDVATLIRLTGELCRRGIDASLSVTCERRGHQRGLQAGVDAVAHLATRLGIADRVRFLGWVPDLTSAYDQSDALVWGSLTESFGIPVIEAMACGLPVVSTTITPSVELLGDCGYYFAPGDYRGAAGQILRLGAMARAEGLGVLSAARERVSGLTWTANANAFVSLLEDVTRSHEPGWTKMTSLELGLLSR